MTGGGWTLFDIAATLNFTGYPAWQRRSPHGMAMATLAQTYANAAWELMITTGTSCHWPGQGGPAACKEPTHCRVAPLRIALVAMNTMLQRCARGLVRHLCGSGAPAALIALVAAVNSHATFYPSVTTECITLGSALETWSDGRELMPGGCAEGVHDSGVMCTRSLWEVAHMTSEVFYAFTLNLGNVASVAGWTYVGAWGLGRIDILSGLLGGDALPLKRRLRMAEIGVFQANTSRRLLERFPSLEMLLVDPYHLHTEDAWDELQYLEEFYISSRETFLEASRWTQPYRARATHMLQTSVAAASWVTPGSLDLVFIDGDHRYESVATDIQAWWPTIREGGAIAGHDFVFTFPGVVEAATKFALAIDLPLFLSAEIWWVAKPPRGEFGINASEVLRNVMAGESLRDAQRVGSCLVASI
eukprot:TRINITY_DN45324_c0_g1_i1.p1 TRINITY_DN45324_c0_g1~~TRINITY_DN45324_c0_g1_i1.p1  ORF type:complete len:417 (-),score=50.90 TRINITY_DN45324_c0_g1_i1:94-1344(-)